ncbi:MAG TPA: hypothetical protein VEF89_12700 [Solirubrobacteraceae bacterium]|nr:hypothetical protein [Solirubrobacteraceae bacterium]
MDPLHPIIPVTPNLPPISPAPTVRGVGRDSSQAGGGQDQRRRRRAQPERGPGGLPGDELDYADESSDGEDDSGLHIDVTA